MIWGGVAAGAASSEMKEGIVGGSGRRIATEVDDFRSACKRGGNVAWVQN